MVIVWLMMVNHYLVIFMVIVWLMMVIQKSGWWLTPLKNDGVSSSVGMET